MGGPEAELVQCITPITKPWEVPFEEISPADIGVRSEGLEVPDPSLGTDFVDRVFPNDEGDRIVVIVVIIPDDPVGRGAGIGFTFPRGVADGAVVEMVFIEEEFLTALAPVLLHI